MSIAPQVFLYGRPGCHLCVDARATLAQARANVRFDLREVDIETDAALLERYLERIPVVVIDGVEVFELFVDQQRFESIVAKGGSCALPQVE